MADTPDPRDVDELDEWLEARSYEIDNEPDNAQAAIDRLLGVVRYLDREGASVDAVYAARVKELAEWRDERLGVIGRRRDRVAERAEQWARAEYQRTNGRVQTWKLANGTLEIRAAQDLVELTGSPVTVGAAMREAGHDPYLTATQYVTTKTIVGAALDAEVVKAGPVLDDYERPKGREAYEARQLVTGDGEALPGLVLLCPTQPRFNLRPALPARGTGHDPAADVEGTGLPPELDGSVVL
jgi:hypothetical protein